MQRQFGGGGGGHFAVEVGAQRVDVAVGAVAHLTQTLGRQLLLRARRLRQLGDVRLALPAFTFTHHTTEGTNNNTGEWTLVTHSTVHYTNQIGK